MPSASGSASSASRAGTIDWRVVFSSRGTVDRQRRMQRAEQRTALVAPLSTIVRSPFPRVTTSQCNPFVPVSRLPACPDGLDVIEPVRAPQCMPSGERLLCAQLLHGGGRRQACRPFQPGFDFAACFAEYTLPELLPLKYHRVLPAARIPGQALASKCNQAEAISGAAADTRFMVLHRQRATPSRVGLKRAKRAARVRDVFRVIAPGSRASLGGDGSSHFQVVGLAANVESQEVGEAAKTAVSV